MTTPTRAALPLLAALLLLTLLPTLAQAQAQAQDEESFRFHGQFRLNSFVTQERDQDSAAGNRLRLRPMFDAKPAREVSLHLELNLGHLTQNVAYARLDNGGAPAFGVRQAVLQWRPLDKLTFKAGLLPLSDRFGDTLYSGDWDFNPLAASVELKPGDLDLRFAAGRLVEGVEVLETHDNMSVIVADADWKEFGASLAWFNADRGLAGGGASTMEAISLLVPGVRYKGELGKLKLGVGLLASVFSAREGNADLEALGFAGRAEASLPLQDKMRLSVLAAVGTGDENFRKEEGSASSFITPMSLAGTHGYWGYTGKLTIQGPTDTGIDDPINLDGGSYGNQNLGRGLVTAQAKLTGEANDWLAYHLGLGWFRGMAEGVGGGTDIGFDAYGQLTWTLSGPLKLDTGAGFASLGDGYHTPTLDAQGAPSDERRNLFFAVSRLQLEY
jgi:hypothetical protein